MQINERPLRSSMEGKGGLNVYLDLCRLWSNVQENFINIIAIVIWNLFEIVFTSLHHYIVCYSYFGFK